MKYLKLFEARTYTRKVKYQYLDDEDTLILKDYIDNYIDKLEIDKSIKKMKLDDFGYDFNYDEIWDDLVIKGQYNDINGGNLYKLVDNLIRYKSPIGDQKYSAPAIRNSMSKMLDFKYKALDIENKLNKRLIKIFEKIPDKYKEDYANDERIDDDVKDALRYIVDSDKYNL